MEIRHCDKRSDAAAVAVGDAIEGIWGRLIQRIQFIAVLAVSFDDFPGRLTIAPDPLAKHGRGDPGARCQLLFQALQAFVRDAGLSGYARGGWFIVHSITLTGDPPQFSTIPTNRKSMGSDSLLSHLGLRSSD
jgi:hypothetical protein